MNELTARIQWMNYALEGKTGLENMLSDEFCYVQMRFICEIVGLSCLAAHGDILEVQSSRFQKEWHTQKILRSLDGLHPDFFPVPYKQVRQDHTVNGVLRRGWHLAETDKDCLSKEGLIDLYNKLGGKLHRGNLLNVHRLDSDRVEFNELIQQTQRLSNLLGTHGIRLVTGEHILCILNQAQDDGSFQTAVHLASPIPMSNG